MPRAILTKEELEKFFSLPNLKRGNGIRDRAILEVLYSTGIRIGELMALTIDDLDLKNGVIRIHNGKGGKDRVVPIGDVASTWLENYIDQVRSKWIAKNPAQRALWLSTLLPHHEPIRIQNIQVLFKVYRRKAGIQKQITPHSLRHTFATQMVSRGANIAHVQRLLGHAQLSTTEIYTRVTLGEVKETHRQCHPREVNP